MPVSASPAPLLGDRLCENGFECVKILPATNDAHGGVIVDLKEPLHSEVFATLLRSSLLHWKQQVNILIQSLKWYFVAFSSHLKKFSQFVNAYFHF